MSILRALAVTALLTLGVAPARAADTPPLPPLTGASEAALKERAALFAELKDARDEADARVIEQRIWKFWLGLADAQTKEWFEASHDAQMRFDYDEALFYVRAIVVRTPDYAEGWNQLGYVLFLAGKYDASLVAIEQTLKLEPMHYAALAGRGIILVQQGKNAEAQAALKQALAIDPWLKERRLIDGYEDGKKI